RWTNHQGNTQTALVHACGDATCPERSNNSAASARNDSTRFTETLRRSGHRLSALLSILLWPRTKWLMPIFIKGDTSMFTFARPLTSKSRRFLFLTLLSICLLVAIPALTVAQVLYGALVGNVTDPNGAAVSGAKVEVTNLATGGVSSVTTDDRGGYSLNDLQVGVYKVTISRSSFKTTIREDVRIE